MSSHLADLENHRIEGYARAAIEAGEDGKFSVPLISHIAGNLHVGGCIDGVPLPRHIEHLVSLYPWEAYGLHDDVRTALVVKLYDAAEIPDEQLLWAVAAHVNRVCALGPTLVHCQAGLNRSNLIAALALILSGKKPDEAIALLREQRCPVVLCNETFERWLLEQK